MSVMTAIPVQPYSAELLEYARKHGVEHILDPLLETTRALFPDATEIRVFLEEDPECSDLFFIVYEVRTPPNLAEWRSARQRWIEQELLIHPIPRQVPFVLTLFSSTP